MALSDLVKVNHPIGQLLCSGVGQAGALTSRIVHKVEHDVYDNDYSRIDKYLTNLIDLVTKRRQSAWPWRTWTRKATAGLVLEPIKDWIMELVEGLSDQDASFSKSFREEPKVRKRFERFYFGSMQEMNLIEGALGYPANSLEPPTDVIFGHTHEPIPWSPSHCLETRVSGNVVRLHNTGGWLSLGRKRRESRFVGARVFVYSTGHEWSDMSIASPVAADVST